MAGADEVVRARIDRATKREATELFRHMGITVSDAIRMMLVQAVAEKALPFEVKSPNRETVAALQDSRSGVVTRVASVDELFADLNEDEEDKEEQGSRVSSERPQRGRPRKQAG